MWFVDRGYLPDRAYGLLHKVSAIGNAFVGQIARPTE